MSTLKSLLVEIKKCTICKEHLSHGVRPVLQVNRKARILIAGQAPGIKVHESGVPFDDASGIRLREWMGISDKDFYDANKIAIIPMGFCYPGTGKSGDLPPRPECQSTWHGQLFTHLPNISLTIVLGKYAQAYYFGKKSTSVTELVKSWEDYWPDVIPLPHPSPRNNIWLSKNVWFEKAVLPRLRARIKKILSS